MAKRLTRHNGRAGKSGVYKSTHNDRTFDTEHADHIGSDRIQQNIYWDCQSASGFAKAGGQSRCHQADQGEGQRVRPRQTGTGQG